VFVPYDANEESNYAAIKFDVSACRAHARKLAIMGGCIRTHGHQGYIDIDYPFAALHIAG
jgi:hypothetical protein